MKRVKKYIKKGIAILLCAAMLCPISLQVVAEASPLLQTDVTLTVGNSLVQVRVNKNTGRYVVSTEDGLPSKTSDRNRLLSFLDNTPDTSFTTIRIDGEDYIFGNDYGTKGGIVTPTRVQGTTATTIWQAGGVQVTQQLRLVTDFADPDVGNVRIRYEVANGSGHAVQLGSRILLDTMLGANDGSAMLADRTYVTNETEFSGAQVPMVWQSSDRQYAANVTARGVLYGWEDALKPDRMVAAHWNTLSGTKWDCEINPYLNFTSSKNTYARADSAVALYYNASSLAAGQTRVYETYYGIGSISDTVGDEGLSVQINAPQKLALDETGKAFAGDSDPFEVLVQVTNDTDQFMQDVAVKLGLSDELKIAGDSDTTNIELDAGSSYMVKFKVSPVLADQTSVASLGVQVTSGEITAEGMKYVIVPGQKGELPKLQITEVAPNTLYTGSIAKKVTLKGTGFSFLQADNAWTMSLIDEKTQQSVDISKASIAIADDSTMTVSLPGNQEFAYAPGECKLRLQTERYGQLSASLQMTNDPNFDRIEYGVMLVGQMQDEEGNDYYGVRLLENEEELADVSDEEISNVLMTIRGTIGSYEMGGHEYYTIANGAIINSAIRYRNNFNKEAVITVTRYSDKPESEDLKTQFKQQFSGWKWFGKVSDALVFIGEGGLYVGDYLFHVGDFYICLDDEKNYELRGADDDSNNEDLNGNISDGEIGKDYQSAEDVEIVTPAGVVGSQLTKTVGALTGFQVEISNAVLGEETISLGGSIAINLPWWSKASKGGDEEEPDSELEKKYNKRDDLNSIGEGQKNDNFLELNMEEMRYGQNSSDNSAYLVGVKADGGINLTDDSMPKFTKAGAGAQFKIDSIDYPGWYIGVDGNVKVGDTFECSFGFSLVKEDSGQCYPDSMYFYMGGDVVKIPLGPVGFLNRMGGGVSGIYDTLKSNFNIFPPTTLSVYTGYVDPTMFTFTVDDVNMSVGGQGISFEAADGKIIGLKIFESIGAHLKLYGTKMTDGSVYPCLDLGMDSKVNILGIVRGETGFWLVADPRLDTIFGPLSLGGKAYVGIFIPDSIPVVGGKELLSVMAELSSYRVYAGIRVIGIPISVSYYWADKKVKFYDDWEYIADEFEIPKEDLENALAVTYDTGDSNVDGVMLFGDNMTDMAVKTADSAGTYSYEIQVKDNDYSLLQIGYDKADLKGNNSILQHVQVYDPNNKQQELKEDENCILQTITADESDSGVEENYLGVGLIAPVNGTWRVESDIPLQMQAHKVDEVAGVQASSVTETNGTLQVDYSATGLSGEASLDVYLVNQSEISGETALLAEEDLEKLSNEELNAYYRSAVEAEPSGYKITETPVKIAPDQEGKAKGSISVKLPENTQSGEYAVRLVLNDASGNAVNSNFTQNTFTYKNPHTPAPVTGFTMTPGGDGQFLMQWEPSDSAEEYMVTVLDENGQEVEGVTGMTTTDHSLYFGYTTDEAEYLQDGDGHYITDENGERIISGTKTVGVKPGKAYIGVVSAVRTVDGTTYISEAARTEPVVLPEPAPAKLTYTVNGKTLTGAAKTSDDSAATVQTKVENAYTGQSDSAKIDLAVTTDQDISYIIDVDGTYVTGADGKILDHSLSAGQTKTETLTLAEGGSNIHICAINAQGDYTQSTITIEVDTTPPELMLDSVVVQSQDNHYTITGTAENNCAVTVDGHSVQVVNGRFTYTGTGNGSTQQITVTAQDRAGNTTSQLCVVIPGELGGLTGLAIAVDDKVVDADTQRETMYAGNQAELSYYGILQNGDTIRLDSSSVKSTVLMGDGAVSLEENTIKAVQAGDAVVMASFQLTDTYALEQTLLINVVQQPITPAEIQVSDLVIAEDAVAGSKVANLYIPGAPEDLTSVWSVSENEYLEVKGQFLMLKKRPDAAFSVTISAHGSYHDAEGVLREYEVSDEFTFDLLKKITEVETLQDMAVEYGTVFDRIDLPELVQVKLNNGETTQMQVQWTKGAYNENLAGHCSIYGELMLPEGVRNPDEWKVKQTVNVQKLQTSAEARDASCTYDGDVIDVSTLFTVDKDAGEAEYTLLGGSGEGTMHGSVLTVTKAGTFKLRLATKATASHMETEATAILTVHKGKQEKPAGLTASATKTTLTTDGMIAGVTEAMEYSDDSGYHWTPVQGNTITGLKSGYYQVRYAENDLWMVSESTDVRISATGKEAQKPLVLTVNDSAVYGDAPLELSVTGGSGDGEITYTSNDPSVVAVEDGKAVIRKAGTVVITATKAEDETYNSTSDTKKITVWPKVLKLKWNNYTDRTYNGKASAVSVQATNLVGEDTCKIRLQGNTAVDAGEYTAVAVLAENRNYMLPENASQTYRILPVSVKIQWEKADNLVYTGKDQLDQLKAVWTDMDGVKHDAVLRTKQRTPLLHAGTYTVTATTGNSNYEAKTDTQRDITINRAKPDIQLTVAEKQETGLWANIKNLLHMQPSVTYRLTATVTGVEGKAQTGTVEFYSNDVLTETMTLQDGQAELTMKDLEIGKTSLYAVFTPDEDSTDHDGGQSETQICQIASEIPGAPDIRAYATDSTILVSPLPEAETALYGEAQYRIDQGAWQTGNCFSGLEAAKTYMVQARYGGNDTCEPSVTQTTEVTTTYELLLPKDIDATEDTAQIGVSENLSLDNREVHIAVSDIRTDEKNGDSEEKQASQQLVISSTTPEHKKTFVLARFKEADTEKKKLRLLFEVELVEK